MSPPEQGLSSHPSVMNKRDVTGQSGTLTGGTQDLF